MSIKEQMTKYREWQRNNPGWELVCDIPDTKSLYIQWSELSQKVRDYWTREYGRDAEHAFEEFTIKKCKVKNGVLCPDLKIRDIRRWPEGFCMLVFKTGKVAIEAAKGGK